MNIETTTTPSPTQQGFESRDVERAAFDNIVGLVRTAMPATLWVTLAAAVLFGGLIGAARLLLPGEQIFTHAIELSFLNSDKTVYPNETPFSLSDIIAPNILRAVYDANQLDKQGISIAEFSSSISIQLYAPTMREAIDRYRDLLGDRKLTVSEKTKIEEDMRREIANLSRQNAQLTFISQRRLPISQQLGEKILRDVVREWATDSIDRRGVLKLPESQDQINLVDLEFANSLDYSLLAELLQKSIMRLNKRIEKIKGFPGAVTLVEPKTGVNVLSLERGIAVLDEFLVEQIGAQIDEFGVSRDKKYSPIALAARISQLEHLKAKMDLERQAVQRMRENFRTSLQREQVGTPGAVKTDRPDGFGGAVIPQLSGDFIDRILSLRDNRSDAEFLQKLANEELELERKVVGNGYAIGRLKRSKEAIEKGSPEAAVVEMQLSGQIKTAIEKANAYWQTAGHLYEQINKAKFSLGASLYRDMALPDSLRVRHPIERILTLAAYLAALFVVAALTLATVGAWQLLQQRGRR